MLGLSQVRKQSGAIIQVGVPMRLDAERLVRAVGAPEGAGTDLASRTAGVGDLVPDVTPGQVTDALIGALSGTGPEVGHH